MLLPRSRFRIFSFNDTATSEIYTLSLHDALPISNDREFFSAPDGYSGSWGRENNIVQEIGQAAIFPKGIRTEEHTSELQSPVQLVCRLLLEKKNRSESRAFILINSKHAIRYPPQI